MKVKVKL
jgi:hypothetical protein